MTEDTATLERHLCQEDKVLQEDDSRLSVTRRRERLCTRLLLQLAQIPFSNLAYKESGAPYIIGSDSHVSIAHSSTFAAIAVSPRSIGIDIEDSLRILPQTVERVLQEKERSLLNQENLPQLWTAKEAAFKAFAEKYITTLSDVYLERCENHWTAHFRDAVADCYFTSIGEQLLCLAECQ